MFLYLLFLLFLMPNKPKAKYIEIIIKDVFGNRVILLKKKGKHYEEVQPKLKW